MRIAMLVVLPTAPLGLGCGTEVLGLGCSNDVCHYNLELNNTDPVAETDFFIAKEAGGFDKYPVNAGQVVTIQFQSTRDEIVTFKVGRNGAVFVSTGCVPEDEGAKSVKWSPTAPASTNGGLTCENGW